MFFGAFLSCVDCFLRLLDGLRLEFYFLLDLFLFRLCGGQLFFGCLEGLKILAPVPGAAFGKASLDPFAGLVQLFKLLLRCRCFSGKFDFDFRHFL